MKKLKKVVLMLFIFGVIFIKTDVIKADSKCDSKIIDIGATTNNISVEIIVETKGKYFYFSEIKYTIPQNYKGEEIVINAMDDLIEAMDDKTYMPGDASNCKITIINNSNYTYKYVENSFYISTENYNKYYELGLANKLNSTIGDLKVFDDNILPQEYTTLRTKNTALQALYGVTNTSSITDNMITDNSIDTELKKIQNKDGQAIYPNGINELHKYYLDYYNNKYNTNYKKLEDFDNKIIKEMFNGNVNKSKIYETNAEIASLGYNWFYNHLLTISPAKINSTDDKYSIGNYMRNYNNKEQTPYEQFYKESFSKIEQSSYTVEGFVMNLNGPDTVNVYQNYNFGFTLGFKLQALKGTVTSKYFDDTGNKLSEDIITENMVGEPYKTNLLNFDNYELIKIEGEEEGKYIDGNIDVTYIYKKIDTKQLSTDTINLKEKTEVELLPPQTGKNNLDKTTKQQDNTIFLGLISSISFLGIILLKKLFNN